MPSKQEIVDAINSKGVKSNCPFCGSNNWDVNENTSAAMSLSADGSFVAGKGQVTPTVQLTCFKCGYVAHFNPLALGLKIE